MLDLRDQFPVLAQTVHGKPLVYLDSAASSQQPQAVIDAVSGYASRDHANVHRGVHTLSQRATTAFEAAREDVARFIGASDSRGVVFTRGTTEAINLVAWSWGMANLGPGDAIVLTAMEHHSNIVPWQLVAERTGAEIRVVPFDDRGVLDLEAYASLLDGRVKLVAVVHVSNALGTVNPVQQMTGMAHEVGAKVLLDGAQAVVHGAVDVAELGCDFYAFSGHKMYAPTGIGALWGRPELLDAMPPWHGGGEMIREVSFEGTTYADAPARFEAGTPNIGGTVGLAAAVRWMEAHGPALHAHEADLLAYGTEVLQAIDGLRIVGTAPDKAGVLSFVIDGVHPQDIGTLLDRYGVAVRTGHHCAQPALRRLGLTATTRASVAAYTVRSDLDALGDALGRALRLLR
ncbi:MAG: cysteine desulfurase/selenocysteine lyase [Myxococcota bacterium]|jgi:cysteine desulfurase/selenocysteine lyase